MQGGRTSAVPQDEVRDLWYGLGSAYSEAGGGGRRAWKLGFTVVCVVGALVLLSAPVFGTSWAGPFAAVFPIAAGLISGGGLFLRGRLRLRRRVGEIGRALAERGLDPSRPARDGLGTYYDAQLVLLRSEYEYLLTRGAKESARLFEDSFGFTPADEFEVGPLSVQPDSAGMRDLRRRWESRISGRDRSVEPPEFGLREDVAYRVYPREMTVPVELATRRAYLEISTRLLAERYGKSVPEPLRRRAERDRREYDALVRRTGPRR